MAKEGTVDAGQNKPFLKLLQELADSLDKIDQFTFSNELSDEMVALGEKVLTEVNKRGRAALSRKKTKIDVVALMSAKDV